MSFVGLPITFLVFEAQTKIIRSLEVQKISRGFAIGRIAEPVLRITSVSTLNIIICLELKMDYPLNKITLTSV